MSALVELLDRIESTNERISQLEKAASQQGAPASLRVSIRSMEKLRASLEMDFQRLAMDEETEICRYRLLPPQGERPTITAIAKAWTQYQALFSSVYDAIRPSKHRASKRAIEHTQFGFGYTFAGSIGVVLTLPTRQMEYATARDLERTAETIAEMAKAETTEHLSAFVEKLGVPPVAKLGNWVDAHVAFASGAGVEWQIWGGRLALRFSVENRTMFQGPVAGMFDSGRYVGADAVPLGPGAGDPRAALRFGAPLEIPVLILYDRFFQVLLESSNLPSMHGRFSIWTYLAGRMLTPVQ